MPTVPVSASTSSSSKPSLLHGANATVAPLSEVAQAPEVGKSDAASSPGEIFKKLAPVTAYAAKSTLVPALMNTPITTSLARPLVQSQYDGQKPELRRIFSTRGWLPALGRTGIRYAIADSARAVSGQAVSAMMSLQKSDGEPLSEKDSVKTHFVVDAGASALMTGASQPLTALQVYRQVQQGASGAGHSQFVQGLLSHPFRGSGGNFLSTFIMFNLDRNDRALIAKRQAGEISPAQVSLIQLGLGGAAGVTSNFLKTHANARALGLTHREIAQKVVKTAQRQPAVFVAQVLYAWALGGIANKLWASSIAALQATDAAVQAHDVADIGFTEAAGADNQERKF